MNESDVAYLLAYIETKLAYKSGLNRVEANEVTVRSWKNDLDHGNCHHAHIAIRAIDDHFRSPDGKYGITPADLVNAYNRLATRMVANLDQITPISPPDDVALYLAERRIRVRDHLADPANLRALDNPTPPVRAIAAPIPEDVAAAIRAATPKPLGRAKPTSDPARLAEARAELDAIRAKEQTA